VDVAVNPRAQRMEALGQLAGGVAHDFNNLLTVIIGYADMLASGLPDEDPTRKGILTILETAQRAANLTRQLLLFSRRQEVAPTDVQLAGAVTSIEHMLRRVIPEHVQLEVALEDPAAVAHVDPGQLDQVLVNLAVNARDAMPMGGRLRIAVRSEQVAALVDATGEPAAPGEYAVIAVADTGVGMDAATRARIFEPFFTTKPKEKGTGLGLATVYGIIKRSGGFIVVQSTEGQGSTFEVYLPLGGRADARAAGDAPVPAAGGSETILLAEDDGVVRGVVLRALRQAGYAVLPVEDGDRAIAAAGGHDARIDLVLTDLVMPGMNGPELVERIRRTRPGVRAIFMTAHTDDHVPARREGDLLLRKPFPPRDLLAAVRSCLDAPRIKEAVRASA
jgi:CheY-like chemotaxis protein